MNCSGRPGKKKEREITRCCGMNASLDRNISEIRCLAVRIDANTGDQTCSWLKTILSALINILQKMPPIRTNDTQMEASTSDKQSNPTKNQFKRRRPQSDEQSATSGVSKIKASLRQTRRFLAKVNLLGLDVREYNADISRLLVRRNLRRMSELKRIDG